MYICIYVCIYIHVYTHTILIEAILKLACVRVPDGLLVFQHRTLALPFWRLSQDSANTIHTQPDVICGSICLSEIGLDCQMAKVIMLFWGNLFSDKPVFIYHHLPIVGWSQRILLRIFRCSSIDLHSSFKSLMMVSNTSHLSTNCGSTQFFRCSCFLVFLLIVVSSIFDSGNLRSLTTCKCLSRSA